MVPGRWRYKNLAILTTSLIILFLIADTEPVRESILAIGSLGYFGSFLAGIFFICSFTLAPAALVLYHFALSHNPYAVALSAGAGAVVGDYLIFRFFKDGVFEELKPLWAKLGGVRLALFLQRPGWRWLLPILGAIIIASPFPDEVGIVMIGASRLSGLQFTILSYVLNSTGIFALIAAARSLTA